MNNRTFSGTRLLALAIATSITGAANAQLFSNASIDYLSVFGKTLKYSVNSGTTYSGAQISGFLTWNPNNATAITHLTNMGGLSNGKIRTICGELVNLGDPQMVDGYLSNNVTLSTSVKRAGAIVGDNYNNTGTNSFFHAAANGTALVSAAFQAAVWAGRYGGGGALIDAGSTIKIGSFWIKDAEGVGGTNWGSFKTSMAGYYNSAFNHNFNGISLFLDAKPTGTTQDQFTMESSVAPVPEPFTMALGAGALALAARRRARRA